MKSKKFSFKGKVGKADEKFKGGSNYGYLQLPDGVGVFSPELETSVTFDIMPYVVTDAKHPERDDNEGIAQVGDLWWRRPFKIHRNIGSENISVVCLTSFGERCPVCEYKAKLQKEGKLDDEAKEALKISERTLYCIIPHNAKKDSKPITKTPHIFDISYAMFGKKLKKEMDDENVSEICMDLVEGASLKVRFDEKSMGGKNSKPFAEAGRIDSRERDKPYPESILEKVPNLDLVLKHYTYAELEAKFFELEHEDEEDKATQKRPTKKVVKEIKDDEDEKLTKKGKAKPTKAVASWEELSKLSQAKLEDYVEEHGLAVDPDDYDDDLKSLRTAIANEQGTSIPKVTKGGAPPPPVKEEEDDDEEEEGDEKDEDDDEEQTTVQLITSTTTIDKLLTIAKEYPDMFKTSMKELKAIKKVSALKKAMLEICEAAEEDEKDEDDLPFKKGVKGSSTTKTNGCQEGHTFGKDCDKYDECDSCNLWDDCMAAKKSLKK